MNKFKYYFRRFFGANVPPQKFCKICGTVIPLDTTTITTVSIEEQVIHNAMGIYLPSTVNVNYRVCNCPNCDYEIKLYVVE